MNDQQHAHQWRPADQAWTCAECTETSATCGTCNGPSGSSLLLCRDCERRAAKVLDDIDAALDLWEPDPRSPMSSPGDMRLVVVHGSGSAGIASPDGIMGELWGWVARWTEHAGPSNAAALDYLRSHHMWAAHNAEASRWPEYLKAMRSLRHQARRIAGVLPKRLPEPCVHCGGQVVQDWADQWWKPLETGLSDVVRCTGCGVTWGDHARWLFSTRQHVVDLPALHPDALVTMAQARMIWPEVPAATWRSWAQRWREDGEALIERALTWWEAEKAWRAGLRPGYAAEGWQGPGEAPSVAGWLPERGEDHGAPLYRVGDLAALVERWADTERPGRRAEIPA